MKDVADSLGLDGMAVIKETGSRLAEQVIRTLKAPEITDVYQALFYFASKKHRLASELWQIGHPIEMREVFRQYPSLNIDEVCGADDPEHEARVRELELLVRAGITASEISEDPEYGLLVNESALRKLVAIAPNPELGKYLLEQLAQQRRQSFRAVEPT
jgi:hypothetical protein